MRVTNVEMYSPTLEEPIDFSLRESDPTARYKVRVITGLDAEEIIPKFYGWGLNASNSIDGRYYNLNMKPREVVMRIVLNPRFDLDESYSDIRDDLYRAISASRTGMVELHFKAGATDVSHIKGFISKFEVPYFVQLPEVQLTVRCDDPMFRGVNPVVMGDTEIATSNPILVPDSRSTAPHGFAAELTCTVASTTLTFQDVNPSPNWQFVITPNGGFLVGDKVYISSEYSNKYLYIIRGGATTQLVDKVSPMSIWPLLFPGANSFYIPEIAKFDFDLISFYAAYWGV